MFRQSLFFLSENDTARRLLTGTPLSRQLAERFVAGETLDEAIAAARTLNEQGLSVSLDYLGESVARREEVDAAVDIARRTIERIAAEGIDANISVKPTQLGLDIDEAFCRESVERVLDCGREVVGTDGAVFVRLDMESAEYTERTVALMEALWADGYRNVGTVLQSCLYRTPNDVRRLIELGARVRLVKGAYREPASIAYPDKADVDRRFMEQTRTLLKEGAYPAIATHDEEIINATRRYAFEQGVAKSSFEFQMLYGVRRDLQQRLQEEGYRVRVYVPFGESWYPYLMRRMAERPANLIFVTASILKESPVRWVAKPMAIGAGAVAGALGTMVWKGRRG